MRNSIEFFYGGRSHRLSGLAPTDMLLGWLRDRQLARGTKEGCNEGDCGACSLVMMRRLPDGAFDVQPVNACIMPLANLDGAAIFTVEDFASKDALHPIQQAVVSEHGSQCGFCTPGFIAAMVAGQLAGVGHSAEVQIAGNLCRCTGYGGLIRAFDQQRSTPQPEAFQAKLETARSWMKDAQRGGFALTGAQGSIYAPADLVTFAALRQDHPDALIVAGATDVGLWMTKALRQPPKLLLTGYVQELQQIEQNDEAFTFGAAVSYSRVGQALLPDYPEAQAWFDRLGSVQVRASGTLGGNIANGSPIGDGPPLMIALGARLRLRRGSDTRVIPIEDFFIAYGKQDLAADELVEAVIVPRRQAGQRLMVEKVSRRIDQDITAVLGAFSQSADGSLRLAFGGMAATPKLATTVMASRNPADIGQDFEPLSDLRASKGYRLKVAENLLRHFLSADQEAAA